jgi:diguanylate cyclase (GGDEF)-like protein
VTFQVIILGAVSLLALLLLVAVFQLQDRPGEPPARRAFQATFVLHFALFCALMVSFSLGLRETLLLEAIVNGSLAGMYSMLALGAAWRSRISLPATAVSAIGLSYFLADMALEGLLGIRVGTVYIAAMNGLCAVLVWRRAGGANAGDLGMAGIFVGWALLNLAVLLVSFTRAAGPDAVDTVVVSLLAASPAFFAGFGIFLVVSYMLDGQRDLLELSHRDALTGLHNRRYLAERSAEIFSAAARRGEPVSLMALDIDRFKLLNDTHGHHGGDLALKQVAFVLKQQTRAEDVVARIGGEEFVVVMQGVLHETAVAVAERIRHAIEGSRVVFRGTPLSCTASFGVVSAAASGASSDRLLREADVLLYRAKEEGRNRVVGAALDAAAASPPALGSRVA